MRSVHQKIRRLRKERKKTLREVAAAICVPLTTYREWEYGRAIRGEHMIKLAKVFGVPGPPHSRPQARGYTRIPGARLFGHWFSSATIAFSIPTAAGLRLRPCNAPE
jgi:transcriptional regulator with XRE-family HTH domain